MLTGDNLYVPEAYEVSSIPGVAGADYPVYHRPPDTEFQCQQHSHPGLYADTQAHCQVMSTVNWGADIHRISYKTLLNLQDMHILF